MKKQLLIYCSLLVSLMVSAQTSGGQITRGKKVVHSQNVSSSLKQVDWEIVKQTDKELITDDLSKSLSFLNTLPSTTSYIEEKPEVQGLLQNKLYNINANELLQYRRVRSIQVKSYGIFSYDYFNCKFSMRNGTIFFQKTTGSQRKSGYIYKKDNQSAVFLGGWSVNDEPQTKYGSENSVIGTLYKIAPNKIIMLFGEEKSFEVYEFAR